jgi:phage repressor protein C with HTH and peptisase S24 domain
MIKRKSRLAMMIAERQHSQNLTDRAISERYGWVQQTFSKWKSGHVPSQKVRDSIADFLGVTRDEVDRLCDAAKAEVAEKNDIALFGQAHERGKVADRKEGRFKFDPVNVGYGLHNIPYGKYMVRVETNVMEPVLLYGCRVWLDTRVFPKPGNEVIVHGPRGVAWIGRLVSIDGDKARLQQYGRPDPFEVAFEAIHPVILAERLRIDAA